MSEGIAAAIENGSFAAISLLCVYGLTVCYKHTKTVPGADLFVLGLLLYGFYALLAMGATGFTGSFFDSFRRVGTLDRFSYMYFISVIARLGLILAIVGLFRIGRGLKA